MKASGKRPEEMMKITMKKRTKKILSLALVLYMLMMLIPFGALADDSVARIGSNTYTSVSAALGSAKSGDTVVLLRDAVLTQNADVPAGVTLIIPCMANDTGYQSSGRGEGYSPDGTATSPATGANGTKYCELTVPAGVTLTVNGTVLVNAVTGRPASGHHDQDVNGGFGQISLAGDIIVNGKLDCYGYIKGSGTVTANKGATVGELYVLRNFRGGTVASDAYAAHVYPANEADCHNIQSTLVIKDRASYVGLVKAYALSLKWYAKFNQVGDSNALFDLADDAYLVKTFENGREVYNFYGGASFKSGEMNITTVTAKTSDFIYPFDGDTDYIFNDGDYHFTQSVKFLTGSTLSLKNANMFVDSGKTVVLYDKFEDEAISGTSYPDRPAAVMNMDANSSLTNNGSFAGNINTESAGIYSGSNAKWGVSSNEIIVTGYSDLLRKDIIGTKAVNVALAINRENYDWKLDGNKVVFIGEPCTVTWYDTDGVSVLKTEQVPYGTTPSYVLIKDPEGDIFYVFKGWDKTPVPVTGDASYVSQGFSETTEKCTVTWVNYDGTLLYETVVGKGQVPVYGGDEPMRASTTEKNYTFSGWDKEVKAVTEDTTYTAVFTENNTASTEVPTNFFSTLLNTLRSILNKILSVFSFLPC